MSMVRICLLLPVALCAAVAEQLPSTVFSAYDGLHSTVSRIVVDSRGFVWLPGPEGLARFDGNGIRIFTSADGLPAKVPSEILERPDGTYWVAAEEQLCLLDPRPDRKRFQCESPDIGSIRRLVEDDRGLWCGTDRGLWRRALPPGAANSWEPVSTIGDSPGRSNAIQGLLKDKRGEVWAATQSGLCRFRRNGSVERWTRSQGLADDFVTAIAETPDAVWAGVYGELVRLHIDPQTGQARIADRYGRPDGLPASQIFDVHSWRGAIWVATSQGLARQLPSGRWEAVRLDPSLSGFPVEALATDALGNLWLGTDGGGAARISGSGLSSFSERDGLSVRKVWAIFEDRNGHFLVVTKDEDHYFLNRFDGYRFHAIRPNTGSGKAWGWSWSQIAVHSRSGDWWLATGLGLLRYRTLRDAPSLQGEQVGLPRGNIFRIFEDSRGALWVSLQDLFRNSLFRRDPRTGLFEGFDESHGLPHHLEQGMYPAAFAEDRSGQVWIGMLDGGLVRFRNGRFQQLLPSSGAPHRGVRALFVDSKGRLWIGSRRQGLLRVDDPAADDPAFFAYTKSSGLSDMGVLAVAEDFDGRIYAASGRGVDRIDPQAPPGSGRIRRFTIADGLFPGELRVALRDRSGAIWFGGDLGLIRIQPQPERTDPPIVLVHSIRINGGVHPISDLGDIEPPVLSLAASVRQVQVDFGGFRHDLLYQTRLSNVDLEWTPPSASRTVHYLSLGSGSYELSIRAVSPEGSVSARPARVRFRIAAPVWRRAWFLLLSAAALMGMIYAIHRNRVAQAVAVERVRTRIASDLHDDIGSSLSQIAVLSEVVRRRADAQDPQAAASLSRIGDISRELVDSMSDIVWAINPRHDQLADLIHRMRRFAGEIVSAGQIRFELDIQGPAGIPLHVDARRDVYLIFKESLRNAVRHSGCTTLRVEIGAGGGQLRLRIADNGKGFTADGLRDGSHGLESMHRRAAKLGATLSIASEAGKGTSVELVVPLSKRAYQNR